FGFARARSVQTDSLSVTNTFGAYPSFRTKAGNLFDLSSYSPVIMCYRLLSVIG
ncbi:hypothetical protein GWI33_012450, partial [Rhynchophorus ferrugineus]